MAASPNELLQRKKELIARIFCDLNLQARVAELLRAREWPTDDDLVATVCMVAALEAIHCGRTRILTPPTARFCGDKWVGQEAREASEIFASLELGELLEGLEPGDPELEVET